MDDVRLSPQAEKFARDYEEIIRQYREEGGPIVQAYRDGLAELEAQKKEREAEYHRRAREVNGKYRARIYHAANIRASKADADVAEDIHAAAEHACYMIGGMHDAPVICAESDAARYKLTSRARKRAERKAEEERLKKMPSRVWRIW